MGRLVVQGDNMVIEDIRYGLTSSERGADFEQAYAAAGEVLSASPHCLGHDLARCVEDPSQYVVRIVWDSAEGHLTGFRGSPAFRTFLQAVRPFYAEIFEMRHYEPVPG